MLEAFEIAVSIYRLALGRSDGFISHTVFVEDVVREFVTEFLAGGFDGFLEFLQIRVSALNPL